MSKISKWLGIDQIYNKINVLNIYITDLRDEISNLKALKSEIGIHNRSISRIIAKLDPIFAEDEISPERKAASDLITEKVMRKLIGEHLANNHHLGES